MEILGYIAAAITVGYTLLRLVKWLIGRHRSKIPEPKSVQLPNRDALVRAIHDVASTAITFLIRTREFNQMKKETPYIIDTGITQAHEDANVAYLAAREKLAQETLVAGHIFQEPISDFTLSIIEQFDRRSELRPEDASGIIDINLKAKDTVKKIDAIVVG